MRNDHPQEHAQRIDRGVGHRGIVARQCVVGIGQCHGIGHAATQHPHRGAKVRLHRLERHRAYNQHRHQRQHKARAYPQQAFGAEHGLEEVCAGIQSQTSQIERQAQGAKHQIGTARGIGDHVQAWAKGTDEDAHDDGAACQSQLDWRADARQRDWNGSHHQAQHDANEYGHQVRLFQALDGIAQHTLHIVQGGCLAYHGQTVAHLKAQVSRGQQLHAAAVDAGDVDAIRVTQVQRAQFAAVQFGTGDYDALRNELAVYGIPVDVFLVPIGMLLLTKKYGQRRGIFLGREHQEAVSLADDGVRRGDSHLALPPEA